MCLGYRVKVGGLKSFLTGFGNFEFFPRTRQSVFVEITFRCKPRPRYQWVMKEAPPGIIHLADMDMKGMSENQFKALWYGSFDRTEKNSWRKSKFEKCSKNDFCYS